VPTQEVIIPDSRYKIAADLKIPKNKGSTRGVVLVHGAIINRKSLSRDTLSLAGYLSDMLNAYVITPDYLGETVYRDPRTFNCFSEVVDRAVRYLCDKYGVDDVLGFGHSMGSHVVAKAANLNDIISHLVTYGGPTEHVLKNRHRSFINYLTNYLYSFDYSVDLRNLLHLLFDKETTRYLRNVMMVDPEYKCETYDYNLDPDWVQDAVDYLGLYLEELREWGKPALILYGENDSLVAKSMKALPDGHRMDNILVKHVKGASHVTPCMDSLVNLKKLDHVVLFHKNMVKAGIF
jgi:pimeloyl-ACP methyl ester carboxylesterase